jgi:hypothetical protein
MMHAQVFEEVRAKAEETGDDTELMDLAQLFIVSGLIALDAFHAEVSAAEGPCCSINLQAPCILSQGPGWTIQHC